MLIKISLAHLSRLRLIYTVVFEGTNAGDTVICDGVVDRINKFHVIRQRGQPLSRLYFWNTVLALSVCKMESSTVKSLSGPTLCIDDLVRLSVRGTSVILGA